LDITVNVTVPKEILSQAIVQDAIAQVMVKKTALEVKTLFRKTVFGWKNKPIFRQKLTRRANYMSEEIWADGSSKTRPGGLPAWKQYALINSGTVKKDYPITPRGQGYPLKFRWGGKGSYKASSTPRIIQSKRHSQSGGIYRTPAVTHPGFDAREFDKTIAEQYDPIFRKDIQDAISVAAAKTVQSNN
jgi:hypothetical protein